MRRALLAFGVLLVLSIAALWMIGRGALGDHEEPGEVTATTRPGAVVEAVAAAQLEAADEVGASSPRQILFGDLHVHTTFSFDAFLASLPFAQGEGAHPPADACDFARFCSGLDFWSINDHAEGITPRAWRETIDSIRQCNEVSGDPGNPDLVSYLGWEWTDVGNTPDDHYGHKNVVLAHTDDGRIPKRPIAAASTAARVRAVNLIPAPIAGFFALLSGEQRYHDLAKYFRERAELDLCPDDVPVGDLPEDCLDTAATPADLFRKLDEGGHDAIVIPHGTTWGMYTPPGSTWDKQLRGSMHDSDRQTLLEIYSGHGDSEVYRDWRALEFDAEGNPSCPEPRPDYLPSCWRAGEIIEERCIAEGLDAEECNERGAEARANAADALLQVHLTVPGAKASDWLDSGQCKDCSQPSFNYRPGGSAQYLLALGNFDASESPRRFRFGFMSSSDNHSARPGTGYKETIRLGFSESPANRTGSTGPVGRFLVPEPEEPEARSRPYDRENSNVRGFALFERERQSSFFMTGGLIAVHSEGRDREAIWDAMQRREVYGTSGSRILLWFDMLNASGTRGSSQPMGSAVDMSEAPIFQVRAVGSLEQLPGCPDYALTGLDADRLAHVCKGECYHPSDRRRTITRVEVVRIRPQEEPDEPLSSLIDDPWRRFDCEPSPAGCVVTFSDPDYVRSKRDTVYYVRAIEEPKQAVNASNVRCSYDDEGNCISVDLCNEDDDLCLGPQEPRAWSSPIFVDWTAPAPEPKS